MSREVFGTADAPAPVASYSQACGRGAVLAVSGQVGVDSAGAAVEGGVSAQTEQAIRNVETVLAAAGATLADVVRMDCYLTSLDDFDTFNEVYARWFPAPDPPARTTVVVGLAPGLLVEVTALAVRR
jgi:2-iminobutanoate/2-iminopropanoate deaminase